MPATPVLVPPLGDSISEVTVLKWYKSTGEKVAVDEPLIEAETDKSNVDIPATAAGVVTQLVKAGDVIKIGQAIANVDPAGVASAPAKPVSNAANPQAGQASASTSSAQAPASTAQASTTKIASPPPAGSQGHTPQTDDLSPAVRRMVEENKLNTKSIPATGPGGRITKEDVVNHLDAKQTPKAEDVEPTQAAPAAPAATTGDADGIRKTPLSKIRKKIAENLVRAQQTAAILTTFNEVDLSAVMAMRTKYKDKFEKSNGVGLGFMSFFSKAACRALKEFPRVNGQLEGDNLVTFDYVNLGIAVSTDRGLAVPVLRHAQNMSFAKIESEIKRLATAVRDGKLGVQEMSGGTFTITNGGVFGSLLSTPIINPPQSAILGMHTIQKRAVVIDDKIEIRPMMYLALSYDHRVIDGKESVSFLVRIKELLEDPSRLLLEV